MAQITASTARPRARRSSNDGVCAAAGHARQDSANAILTAFFISLPRLPETPSSSRRCARHKIGDGFFDRAIVPGGQRVSLRERSCVKRNNNAGGKKCNDENSPKHGSGRHFMALRCEIEAPYRPYSQRPVW